MSSEHKAFASLSSGLLARKGDARPAMRRQNFGEMGQGLDDLGWNDMGDEAPAPAGGATPGFKNYNDGDDNDRGVLAALGPLAGLSAAKAVHDQLQSVSEQANSVREQQADIAAHFAVPEDELSDDGEDVIDETAEAWDPEAEDDGNVFNSHLNSVADSGASKPMATLDSMQFGAPSQPSEPPAGFVPFDQSFEDEAAEAETAREPVQEDAEEEVTGFDPTESYEDWAARAPEEEELEEYIPDEEAEAEADAEAEATEEDEVEATEKDEVEAVEDEAVEAETFDIDDEDVEAEAEEAEDAFTAFEPADPEPADLDAFELAATPDEAEAFDEDEFELAAEDAIEPVEALEDSNDEDEEEALLLDETVEDEPLAEVVPIAPKSVAARRRYRSRAAAGSKDKAAFTLRLDKDRHLRLRLASVMTGQSAQKLMIEALDKMLAEMPEVDAMADKGKDKKVG